jgi:hypothetical protein
MNLTGSRRYGGNVSSVTVTRQLARSQLRQPWSIPTLFAWAGTVGPTLLAVDFRRLRRGFGAITWRIAIPCIENLPYLLDVIDVMRSHVAA